MRLTDSGASRVCTVDSTRWPVSAADRAARTVSSSRISPMRITSGSWRSTRRIARENDEVSMPTSRWLMIELRSGCRYSIGSSIVDDVAAVGAVDVVDHRREGRGLPRAGGSGEQDQSTLLLGDVGDHRRQAEVSCGTHEEGDHASDDRDRAALAEGVDAEAGDTVDGVGEVDLAVLVELGLLGRVAQHLLQGPDGVLRGERLGTGQSGQAAVDCARAGGEGTLR